MAVIASGYESAAAASVDVVGVTASMGVPMDVVALAITVGLAAETNVPIDAEVEGGTIPTVG